MPPGLETLTLGSDGGLEATFAPGAGMVCCSLLHEGAELLGLNDGLGAYAETGATMGVPLLHPWANRLEAWKYEALGRRVDLRPVADAIPREQNGLPIHGTLPAVWEVVERSHAGLAAELDPGDGAAFPFPHRVRIDAEVLGATLRVRTTVTATAAEPVPVVFGFHPYLSLAAAPRATWEIELPVRRRLVLDARSLPTGEHEPVEPYAGPLGELLFDDGYDRLAEPPVFALTGAGRRVEVAFEGGYPVAQVYAPASRDVICFEPMTAQTNALARDDFPVATPDAPYAATFSARVARA